MMKKTEQQNFLFEVSAEVCTKLGGIHTVIKSKAAFLNEMWKGEVILIGALLPSHNYENVFLPGDEAEFLNDEICHVIRSLREAGQEISFGFWNISGKPQVLLLNPFKMPADLPQIKHEFEQRHLVRVPKNLFAHLVVSFGVQVYRLLEGVSSRLPNANLVAHFHEYMSAFMLPAVKDLGVTTIFTTHATVLGRWLAQKDADFDRNLPTYTTRHFKKAPKSVALFSVIESNAAKSSDLFTTVSERLAVESRHLLGRYPSCITLNGVSSDSFNVSSEQRLRARQALEKKVKEMFPDVRLNQCVYIFTSGRYEYANKGFDVIVKSLARLNNELKKRKSDKVVVMFFVTDTLQPSFGNFLVNLLTFRLAKKLYKVFGAQLKRSTSRYFLSTVHDSFHDSELVSDLPKAGLKNRISDKVKVILHPSFVSTASPLGVEYFDFVGCCDLGMFPSRYEPWGYTPAECYFMGTPTVTTLRSGFGKFVADLKLNSDNGMFILNDEDLKAGSDALSNVMNRIVEGHQEFLFDRSISGLLDWKSVMMQYTDVYDQARTFAVDRRHNEPITP